MRVLCLIVLIANGLRADIYEAIKVSSNGYITTTYKYGHHGSLRLWQTSNFRNHHIVIWNEEHQTAYELDPNTHEYREASKTDSIALFAKWIARPHVRQSGKTVDVYHEVIDTGERRQILGQTAKHLHLRERRVAAPGACVESSVTEDDGWYIIFPEPDPGSLGTIANKPVFDDYEGGEISACRDTVITHGDFRSLGLLVFQEKNAFTLEVIALSSAPLDKSLFEAPRNYKKVDHFKGEVSLTWTGSLAWDWSQIIDSVATWF